MGLGDSFKKIASVVNPVTAIPALAGLDIAMGKNPFSPDKTTTSQVPLETEEQRRARQALLQLFLTGRFGEEGNQINLGEDLNLAKGDFSLSPEERLAIGGVRDRFNSGTPTALTRSIDAAMSFLEDPTIDPAGTFAPFKQRVERELQDRTDALKRSSAFAGNLFSTNTIQGLGDVQNRGTEALTSELANLTNQALDRRLTAAGLTGNLSSLLEEIQRGRISDLLGVGGIERGLTNQRVGQEREDVLRRRGESLSRLDALNSIIGSPVQFGVPSITTETPSSLMQILQAGLPLVGSYLGAPRVNVASPTGSVSPGQFSGGGRFTNPLSIPGFA